MGDEISIHLFCHSLGSRLRLLLRLVKVLLEFGLSGHAAGDCRLGWFRDGSDGAILLLRLLLRTGYVETAWNYRVWWHWFGPSLRPGKPLNSLRWCRGRHYGAEGAISTVQYTCLHWPVIGDATNLYLKKSHRGEFLPIGLIAHISSMHPAGPSSSTLNPRINFNGSDKWQSDALLAWQIKISRKFPEVSLCFAHSEFDCSVRLTHENHWILLVSLEIYMMK